MAVSWSIACSDDAPPPVFESEAPDASSAGPVVPAGSPDPVDAGNEEDTCPRLLVKVPPSVPANVRPEASTAGAPAGTVRSYAVLDRVATVQGQDVGGVSVWYQVSSPAISGFIHASLVQCTQRRATKFWLPLGCDASVEISQGNLSNFSHQGQAAYAFDFALGVGVPLVAVADGVVVDTYDKTRPGSPCYNGGDSSCVNEANLVIVSHADGSRSVYAHLSKVLVKQGDTVTRGQKVGLTGSTGWSTGPHAHVEREEECEKRICNSIPLEFEKLGVPTAGQTVVSNNCPEK
jgi:murein DD-endopeptidase MepM/ murein hydrolase activator NlpD